ncbi:helical backbone metal receptor [Smaragdicoccus niigatensis]|uniref:helical backbone metal receptor n=1 Tax=Smaragdicoccus niigatensis TaxID=359359 RepID=UPI000373505E|nr:helical backbone metal receptor [Smaragdicoccus niigatensis]
MSTVVVQDDLGAVVELKRPVRRVISLVPSLTEAVAESDRSLLVGATDWCTHPVLDVPRVRGTKNPNVAAITQLRPDLVLANQEENRAIDVDRLRNQGIAVWVTKIESVDEALSSMTRLFAEGLGLGEPEWLSEAKTVWADVVPAPARKVVIPIWRDPWMVVGRDTFTGDLARRLGYDCVHAARDERYPKVSEAELNEGIDLAILPDEPYVFTETDGPEAFPGLPVALVDGRSLTWYGPSLRNAPQRIQNAVSRAHTKWGGREHGK